jgi:acetoacetyl-CoA synthetase
VIPYLLAEPDTGIAWAEFLPDDGALAFERVPFDHPLWILFSSGTTGPPKPIVHGHGGVTLELHKLQGLQHDLGPGDTYFWFTTTGWVMWNLQVSGLLVGAGIVLFDGDPGGHDMGELWRLAADTGVTYFGVSAPFLMQCRRTGVVPADWGDLSRIREVGSTGAPLPEEGFDWLYQQLGPRIRVNSTSGGTDVCTSFVGGAPLVAVRAGEIACRQLACRVESWDEKGRSLTGEVGEMVVTAPMPSMPVGFWGDLAGKRYRAAYFEQYPGVWRHGDWITIHPDGHCVISGRSDATLNRGGVRLGTAEFYRVVEDLDGVADSLVVHLDSSDGDAGELVLFVVPSAGRILEDGLADEIKDALRVRLSPRHVPDAVHAVPAVPRTLSGKKLEIPVKRILRGATPGDVADPGALANPTSLDTYVALRRTRR